MVDDPSRSYGCTLFKLKTGAPHIKTTHPLKPILSQIISYYLKKERSDSTAPVVLPGPSIHLILRLQLFLSQKGCRARQASSRRAGGHDARASRRSKPKYLFLFVSFQSGLHEACGAEGVNFFFLFRMLFLNITGFSLVC